MVHVVINVVMLSVIIAVHEYGHFYFARKYGIVPEKFVIGFGPTVYSSPHKGTRYGLGLIPFGGYVSIDEGKVDNLPTKKYIMVYLGGPLANLLLCIAIGLWLSVTASGVKFLPDLKLISLVVIGTIVLFFAAVPLTLFVLGNILLHPIAHMTLVSGPIGIARGEGLLPEGMSPGDSSTTFFLAAYILSLAIGSFNLMPLSILDGGKMFAKIFSRHEKFVVGFHWVTNSILIILMLYIVGTDIYKVFVPV